MSCNRITKPIFTKSQIAECHRCKHISAKKRWCCLFGVEVIEKGKVLVPDKKIKMPSMVSMGRSFVKESARYIAAGRPKRSPQDQESCQAICRPCENYIPKSRLGPRCALCGCCVRLKKLWATAHCPVGLW